jgi:hypothetical protein
MRHAVERGTRAPWGRSRPADLKTLYTATTSPTVLHPQKVSFLSTALDGSTTFEAWDHGTLNCLTAMQATDVCGGAGSVTLTYGAPVVTMVE